MTASFLSCSASRQSSKGKRDLSPYEYGLAEAKNGIERYQVLQKTHKVAASTGVNVDYTGIDTIAIEIPHNAPKILLTQYNDFKGCVFLVKNQSNICYLFYYSAKSTPISVDKKSIDTGHFDSYQPLSSGQYLLIVEDENPWVQNRRGHSYGHIRKDVLLINNGRSRNSVTAPYNNDQSSPKCSFIPAPKDPLIIKNLHVKRDESCTFVTDIIRVSGYNDVRLQNVSIYTPSNQLINDAAISISDCANVSFTDVSIDGTYSQPDHSGYGISLNNVWNFRAIRLYGKGAWGIFGNNNVNQACIEDSQINRFDIHCYGRSIAFKNVVFFDRYNQFSSVFGTVSFKNCIFTNFVPVLLGTSYNAYVGFDITMTDCVFNVTPEKNNLVNIGVMPVEVNTRVELSRKCWPNISIHNLVVNMSEGTNEFGFFNNKNKGNESKASIDYLSKINVDGLIINPHPRTPLQRVYLCKEKIVTNNLVDCAFSNVVVKQSNPQVKSKTDQSEVLLEYNMPVESGHVLFKSVRGLR